MHYINNLYHGELITVPTLSQLIKVLHAPLYEIQCISPLSVCLYVKWENLVLKRRRGEILARVQKPPNVMTFGIPRICINITLTHPQENTGAITLVVYFSY